MPTERLDLAAMALDSSDIPPELQLVFESYFDIDQLMQLMIGDAIDRDAVQATGLNWFYQSSYATPSGTTNIRSYVIEYAGEAGAFAGFDLLENEETFVPGAAFTDEPGPGIGEEPSEITIGSYGETVPDTGPTAIDVTFRVGRIVAGVGIDVGEGLTVDRELTISLAERLHQRIEAVLAGTPIPAIDTSIAPQMVGLGEGWSVTNEGYWTLIDVYGPDVATDIASGFNSGYFRADAYDPNATGGFPIPRVAIEVASFFDEQTALFMLSDFETLKPPPPSAEEVSIDPIPGSSVTLAYQFPNQFFGGTDIDSFRIVMLVGSSVITVDIQGNGTQEAAREAAVAIASAQASCALGDGPCDVDEMPADLFITPDAVPSGTPVG